MQSRHAAAAAAQSWDEARQTLEKLLDDGHAAEDARGILAMTYKEEAFAAADAERKQALLRRARDIYQEAFHSAETSYRDTAGLEHAKAAYYNGVNAAALTVHLDEEASDLLTRTRQICQELPLDDFWLKATFAEISLLGGDRERAKAYYRKAIEDRACTARDRQSIRRQFERHAQLGKIPAIAVRDAVFPQDRVILLDPKSLSGSGKSLKCELGSKLGRDCRQTVIFSIWSDLAQIATFQLLHEMGADLYLLATRPFRQAVGANIEEIDALYCEATVNEEYAEPFETEEAMSDFLLKVLAGLAKLRAQAVFASVEQTSVPQVLAAANSHADGEAVKAMLFADAKGYSHLTNWQLNKFNHEFLPLLADSIAPFQSSIDAKRTAGDGLFLVINHVSQAPAIALALRDAVQAVDWEAKGYPPSLSLRIAIDVGPVRLYHDPVMKQPEVAGRYVNRAARIEPITPPGKVYATESLAAIVSATGGVFRFAYAGRTALPKGFGESSLYAVEWR